jgi:hypothetical protein
MRSPTENMDVPPIEPALLSPQQRAALAALFRNTTNSYKFLLFLTLVDVSRGHDGRSSLTLPLRELLGGMLATAWFPHAVCRLSFGVQDTLARFLQQVRDDRWVAGDDPGVQNARAHCREWARTQAGTDDELRVGPILRYVVTRLIRPFFESETRGLRDDQVDARIAVLSREEFDRSLPLYRIDDGGRTITLHPSWVRVLRLEAPVFEGWAAYHWLQYMQRCNPNSPALVRKLLPPPERESLQRARQYWLAAMDGHDLRCPYSGRLIGRDTPFDIDHFVPWSFLVHDEFWNLVPVDPATNSRKGQQLPDVAYVTPVAATHFVALQVLRRVLPVTAFAQLADSYVLGLNMDREIVGTAAPNALPAFTAAFERTLCPLLDLARAHGFQGPWAPTSE